MDLAWPTVNKVWSPNKIMKVFIILVITPRWMVRGSVLCWTLETLRFLFSESVLNTTVDSVPLRLPPPGCRCLVYICKYNRLDYIECDETRKTGIDFFIYSHWFLFHVKKYNKYELAQVFLPFFVLGVIKFERQDLIL
jgi:hypothetical protein